MATITTGAGAFPAGAGPAGLDPVGAYSTPGIMNQLPGTQVALFDLASRSNPVDATTGLVKRIHWVDQAVALALGVTNGKLTAQPKLGNQLRAIRRNDPIRLEAVVKDAVRLALLALIDRKDILVTDVQISQPVTSQILVKVWYLNLRLNKTPNLPANLAFVF